LIERKYAVDHRPDAPHLEHLADVEYSFLFVHPDGRQLAETANRCHPFAFVAAWRFDYPLCGPPATPAAAVGEPHRLGHITRHAFYWVTDCGVHQLHRVAGFGLAREQATTLADSSDSLWMGSIISFVDQGHTAIDPNYSSPNAARFQMKPLGVPEPVR